MAASKVMHGARAKVFVVDPNTQTPVLIGIFHTISWGLQFDVAPVNILGNFNAVELVYTGQEPVSVSCSGFRLVENGPHKIAKIPNTKDLLTHEYLVLQILDRQTGTKIGQIRDARPVSYSTALNARQLEEISVQYTGLWVDDESTTLSERSDAATLPA
jgi:hypothetical protein